VPPYVDVRYVADATTTGSGAGAATNIAELASEDIVERAEVCALTGIAAFGAGAGAATGLRSVVASTTM